MDRTSYIQQNLAAVRARIANAERLYGRAAGSVTLLPVSKGQPVASLRAALAVGEQRFGESYVQEASAKIDALRDAPVEWHFIGPVQSNKTRTIAQAFAWVHGVARESIAERLAAQRPSHLPPLSVCLQVNISGETNKSGVTPTALEGLAQAVSSLPRLRLRGLMCIPRRAKSFDEQRAAFRRLRELLDALRSKGFSLDTLSMGMSDDLEAAVAEGSTLVRVGTAIFGARDKRA